MRLNVVGVSNCSFLPRLVAVLTRFELFQVLKNTLQPRPLRHSCSRGPCVDLPEPSTASTALRGPVGLSGSGGGGTDDTLMRPPAPASCRRRGRTARPWP